MFFNIFFLRLLDDGSYERLLYDSNVRLDYWTIREWYSLYHLLLKHNKDSVVKLEIIPISNEVI